ncbi:CoA-disulfide reductase [Spiroplasma eriocheiris]|uniref:NADH oxidase n=1 Tax=Spiroplasma eriocheiris TaxID=315358 RepID=A0A0H3XL19_9MOLU|nr:CoA-disulfide reductase [Spiroplasma eriocheiris]AHF57728.1 NADH oxidase [Spiroplasma eriocheiris CCTCC M 207170]AKM54179.1 NADH oxidase [Spiroplasma eriocheiris]
MKVIVLGGSAAGMGFAAKLRRNDPQAEIVVYQKSSYPSFGACGIPYFISDQFQDPNQMIARTVEKFQEQNINVKLNMMATKVDFNKKMVTIRDLSTNKEFSDQYDKLFIATGARPRTIKNIDPKITNVYNCSTKEDAIAIKKAAQTAKNVVIVGAGFIGMELTETFYHLQKKTTIVESSDLLIHYAFDKEVSALLEQELADKKIDLYKQSKVTTVVGDENNQVASVTLDNGTVIPCDLLIITIGFQPNTDFLDENAITLQPVTKAIVIDEHCQTSVPDVYSGGDCATVYHLVAQRNEYIPLATNANKLAKVAANVVSGIPDRFPGALGTSIIQVIDKEAAATGVSEHLAANLGLDYASVTVSDFDHTNYVHNQQPLFIKLIYEKTSKKLLGAQMCGSNKAVLRIDALAAIIWKEGTVYDLQQLDLAYAPPFARAVDIIHIASARVKR